MNLAQLLNCTTFVSVEHYTRDISNTNKEGYVSDLGLAAVPMNIQPSSNEVIALTGGAYGKSYTGFTTASGILDTDRLTTVSGSYTVKYIVKGRQYFNQGQSRHLELLLEEVL